MKKIILSTVMSAALLSMGSASAGGTSSASANTFYGGGSIGQAQSECDDCKESIWKVFAGYKFTDNLGVEAGYYGLGEEDNVSYTGIGVTGIYAQPLTDNFEVFGKLGIMFWDVEAQVSGYSASFEGDGVLFGVGANHQLTENWGVRAEWERFDFESEDIDILSAGINFSTY